MPDVFFCRSVRFCARHHYGLPDRDEAENLKRFGVAAVPHEHLWTLTIWLRGPIDPVTGMMADLGVVDEILRAQVLLPFEGVHINQVDPFFQTTQPTTEVLAGYFARRLVPHFKDPSLVRLRVAESADIFAEWQA